MWGGPQRTLGVLGVRMTVVLVGVVLVMLLGPPSVVCAAVVCLRVGPPSVVGAASVCLRVVPPITNL